MGLRELADKVKEQIAKYIPMAYGKLDIQACSIWKNNVEKIGITIRKEGEDIAPAYWLNSMEGTAEEICRQVAQAYIEQQQELYQVQESVQREAGFMLDYSQVRTKLRCRVIGADGNREFLKGIVYRKVLNLAVAPYVELSSVNSIINVTRNFLEEWGVREKQVLEDALKNMARKEAVLISTAEGRGTQTEDMIPTMYMLSNREYVYGAFWMLDREKLKEIGNMLGSFTILPSSINEVIIVADAEVSGPEIQRLQEMEAMVREINAMEVPAEERLSNTVYHYDVERQILAIPLHGMEIPARELLSTGRDAKKQERRGR